MSDAVVINDSTTNPYIWDMASTRFALHIRGDLPSSNRLFDILKVGAVPVAISDQLEMTLPFPDVVPWDSMLVRIKEKRMKKPDAAEFLAANLKNPATMESRRRASTLASRDLLWEVNGSRVTTNVLL